MSFEHQSKAILESLINSFSNVIIFALDTEYRYMAFNTLHKNEMKEIWGVDIRIGSNMLDYISNEEDRIKAKENFDRALSGESFVINEIYGDEEFKRAYYENHYHPIKDENNNIIGLTLFLTEITERIKREEELKKLNEKLEEMVLERTQDLVESEERYKQLVELSPDIIGLHSEGKLIYVNSVAVKTFRAKSYQDIVGKSTLEFIHPDSRAVAMDRMKRLYEGEEFVPFIVEKFIRLDGTTFEAEIAARRFNFKGKPAVHVYVRDISERLEAERKLEEVHNIFLSAIENISGVPYRSNYITNKFDFLGEKIEDLVGVKMSDLDIDSLRDFITDIEIKSGGKSLPVDEVLKKYKSGELKTFHADYRVKLKDGSIKWISDSAIPLKDETGKVVASLGILQDITERKLNELKLIEEEQKFRQLIEQSSDGVVLVNHDGKIIEWNRSEEKITGVSPKHAIGKFIWDVTYDLSPTKLRNKNYKKIIVETFKKALSGKNMPDFFKLREYVINTEDGERKIVQTSNFTISAPEGLQLGIVMRDVTEKENIKRNLEKSIQLAEKADKLKSEFLAQISHEIRTPINVMLSFSEYIRTELEGEYDKEFFYGFEAIKKAGNRIIRTVDLILNVAELQKGIYDYRPDKLDVMNILKLICTEEKSFAAGKNIEVNLINNAEETVLFIDEYSVTQIFRNLINNAIKYTNKGSVNIIVEDDDENNLSVSVIDTGIGINKEYLPRLFELFSQEEEGYTRKFDGNGLGLALTKEYCNLNNAEIFVESEKGKGSKFIVKFQRKES